MALNGSMLSARKSESLLHKNGGTLRQRWLKIMQLRTLSVALSANNHFPTKILEIECDALTMDAALAIFAIAASDHGPTPTQQTSVGMKLVNSQMNSSWQLLGTESSQ